MIGQSMSMSTSQTTGLKQLSRENQADGVAIVNTSMQIAGALGSSLFVGIMTAYQNSYLNNVTNPNNSQNKIKAIYSGFSHSTTVATILIAIGFLLSLSFNIKERNKITDNTK